MRKTAAIVLRVALALTLLLVGVMIWINPSVWHSYLQPWAQSVKVAGSSRPIMQAMAILDILLGAAMIFDLWTWIAALVAAIALLLAIIAMGLSNLSILCLGLFGAAIALCVAKMPEPTARKMGLL